MTVPNGSLTCAPWADETDLCHPCSDNGPIPTADQFQAASDILFELSGRQFPGLCTRTVRPTARGGREFTYGLCNLGGGGFVMGSADADSLSSPGAYMGMGHEELTGGSYVGAITLGYQPIVSVQQVKIDGVVLAPSNYRIDDAQYLVRLPGTDTGTVWPTSQRLNQPDTAVGTFSVTFTYGRIPNAGGVHAASILACEFARACGPNPSDCRLPQRVTTLVRQGVTQLLLDPLKFLDSGQIGIYECDLWIKSVNPKGLASRASVVTPDLWPPSRRQTWP